MIRNCLLTSATAVALCLVISGCSQEPATVKFQVVEPTKTTLAPPLGTIKVIYGGRLGDTVIEKHTTYPNGDRGHVFFRSEDGTLRETREEYASGALKSAATFDKTGKRILNGEVRRPDNSRYMHLTVLEDGTRHYTFYSPQDKKAVYREYASDAESFQDVFYRTDGSALGRVDMLVQANGSTQDNWIDVYPNGRDIAQKFRVQFMAPTPGTFQSGQMVTFFDQQDKKQYSQLWRQGSWTQGPAGNLHLENIDEYDWSGNVSRSLFFNDENNVVSIVSSKQKQTFWGRGGNSPFGGMMMFPFMGISTALSVNDLLVQTPPTGFPKRPPVRPGLTPDPRPFGPSTSSTVEVEKTYRVGEEKQPEVELATWQQQTWDNTTRTSRMVTMKRIFHSGTCSLEKRGDQEIKHEADENLHEANIVTARFKNVKYDELLQTRTLFQREDKSFLGQPDPKDPCRWYQR